MQEDTNAPDVRALPDGTYEVTLVLRLSGDRLAEVLQALETPRTTPSKPITSWKAVADAAGVSEDTLLRRRKAAGSALSRPTFVDSAAAIRWVQSLEDGPRRRRKTGITLAQVRK